MLTFIKKNFVTFLILLATLVLAAIAVFTAVRLYQLRQTSVAPNSPQSKPAASESTACEKIKFTISVPTASPTLAPTASPTLNPTSSPTLNPSASPTIKPTATPTASPTIKPTSTPTNPPANPTNPTPTPALPDTGASLPTIVGGAVGVILLIGAILLAI